MADSVLARQDQAEKLEAEIERQIYRQSLPPEDISALRLVLESLRRIGEYATDIAEIVLNLTVSKLTYNDRSRHRLDASSLGTVMR
jgi:phosphate uptake regulator